MNFHSEETAGRRRAYLVSMPCALTGRAIGTRERLESFGMLARRPAATTLAYTYGAHLIEHRKPGTISDLQIKISYLMAGQQMPQTPARSASTTQTGRTVLTEKCFISENERGFRLKSSFS